MGTEAVETRLPRLLCARREGCRPVYSLRSAASRRAVPCAARSAVRRLAPWAGRWLVRCAARSAARPYVFPSS